MYPSYTFIYHSIPSYDGICEYMSGYQGVRIPDGVGAAGGVDAEPPNLNAADG